MRATKFQLFVTTLVATLKSIGALATSAVANLVGGEYGCGLYFCGEHLLVRLLGRLDGEAKRPQLCDRCIKRTEDDDDFEPYEPKPDVLQWIGWKLQQESWLAWREENPEETVELQRRWDTEPRDAQFMKEFAELY